jgi:hypothetical protein
MYTRVYIRLKKFTMIVMHRGCHYNDSIIIDTLNARVLNVNCLEIIVFVNE